MKATFILTMPLGDTYIDVHGCPEQIDEIYIHDTDIDITELIHTLNYDNFYERFQDALYA